MKEKYSGKKRMHADQNLVLANENTTKVVYLSPTVAGKKHDKKLADESPISYPPNAMLTKDTGFQGYEPPGIVTLQPKKKERARLNSGGARREQNDFQCRIVIENVICGIKRCRLVKDPLRLTKNQISDLVMELDSGNISGKRKASKLGGLGLRATSTCPGEPMMR